MKKQSFILVLPFFVFSALFLGTLVSARSLPETVSLRSDWYADDDVLSREEKFNWPSDVYIIPINKKNLSYDVKDVQELYYYFSTRSAVGDMPFHYLVTSSGGMYQGHSLEDEALIPIDGAADAVLVGYLYDGDDIQLSIRAIPALKEVLLDVINYYAVKPANISVRSLQYTVGQKGRVEDLALKGVEKSVQNEFKTIISSLADEYKPKKYTYNVALSGDVVVPADELEPLSTTEVTVTVKNTGTANIYASPESTVSVVRDDPFDERSLFYLKSAWDTPSSVILLQEGERLAVDEEKTFTFEVFVPLYPPKRTESFVLVGPSGKAIEGTEFKITLNIKKTDDTIIEVQDTPVGYLNVRATAGLGEVVTKVSPGERFIVLDTQTGYYKIEANGKKGWVVNTYVRVIQ